MPKDLNSKKLIKAQVIIKKMMSEALATNWREHSNDLLSMPFKLQDET